MTHPIYYLQMFENKEFLLFPLVNLCLFAQNIFISDTKIELKLSTGSYKKTFVG